MGLELRGHALGLGIQDLGFRDQGLDFKVSTPNPLHLTRFRVWGLS